MPDKYRAVASHKNWNYVYHHISYEGEFLHWHIPGSWFNYLEREPGHKLALALRGNTLPETAITIIVNGDVSNVQVQQHSPGGTQIIADEMNLPNSQAIIDQICLYEDQFDREFETHSQELREALSDAQVSIDKKDVSGWRKAKEWIKDLCLSTTGSLIATGILELLKR